MPAIFNTLAQAATDGAQGAGPSGLYNILFLVAIMVVFYFFMIRPQMQRQKKEKQFRESLKKGDRVVTIGGLHGRIAALEEKTVLLEVDEGVKLKFDKASIREMDGDAKPDTKKD